MYVFPNDFFHVRTDRWRCVNYFVHEKLIQDRRFAGIVQADNNNLVLFVREQVPQLRKQETHAFGCFCFIQVSK